MLAETILPQDETRSIIMGTEEFRAKVTDRLEELLDIPFPRRNNLAPESEKLGQYELTANLQNFLRKCNYSLTREPGKLKLERNGIIWWISGNIISFYVYWGRTSEGASIVLETTPAGGNGNHRDAAVLARNFKSFGHKLHRVVEELALSEGKSEFSWAELQMEPNVGLHEFFLSFAKSYPGAKYLEHLAKDEDFTPLDPSPYYWSEDVSADLRVVNRAFESAGYVPKSSEEDLRELWLGQYRDFFERVTPPKAEG